MDSVVTDPPYHLTSIVKRFGKPDAVPAQYGSDGAYARASRGFMGQTWDGGDIAANIETWRLVYSLLKPGGHLVAFGGTRTYHRMVCAIEDAGFEIRDTIMWLYGSGFPKSHNIGDGWGTALKPACEPIVLARKPLSEKTVAANVLKHGTGALNIEACRIPYVSDYDRYNQENIRRGQANATKGRLFGGHSASKASEEAPSGRWPANVVHDGGEDVVAEFAPFGDKGGGMSTEGRAEGTGIYGKFSGATRGRQVGFGDSGTAARFFYSAKANKGDRSGSKHPTCKPVALIRWLVRMVTPKGGWVLDPFAGSGTLAAACHHEGLNAILIEKEEEYYRDILARVAALSLDMPLMGQLELPSVGS